MAARREGGVWVNDSGEPATIILNADGTAVSAGGGGGTSSTDDGAYTVGVSSLTPVGGVVTADSVDAGDAGAFAMLANRQQKITLYDSSGVEITSFGGGTQYTEDAAAAANPVGNALIVVRDDARGGSLTTADGDNLALRGTNAGELYVKHVDAIPVTDNGGALTVDGTVSVSGTVIVDGSGVTQPISHAALTELAAAINVSSQLDVNIAASAATLTVASHAVTNAGTFAVQVDGAALTSLQLIDDAVKTDDAAFTPATDKVLMIGAQADETTPDAVDEGDAGALRMTLSRGLHVNLRDASGNEVSVGGGTQYDEDTAHVSGDKVTMAGVVRVDTPGALSGTDGDRTLLQVDANGALRVTGGGGGTEYTVDAAAPAAPVGATFVMERDDALSALTEVEGDWTNPRASANGALWVAVDGTVTVASHAVTNAGTFAVQESGAALTALQLIDDAIVADDAAFTPATTKVMMAGFEFDDTTPDSVDEGDAGAARMSANRNVYTQIRDAAGNERGANVNASNQLSVSVDNTVTVGSHAVTNAGTFAVQVDGAALTALQLIDDGVATVASAITTKGMAAVGTDGTNARILKTDTAGELQVDVLTLPNVTLAAGTNTNEVVGDAAHDAGIAGNPVRIGGRALTADYTAVAAGDTADIITTLLGKQVIVPYANPNQSWSYAAASGGITNTTGVIIKTAAGAGVRNYLTDLQVINGHATVSTDVQVRDGAGGTVLWRGFAQAAGGGVSVSFDVPIRGTANTLLEVACGTTGSATYVNASGFTAAE